jgi:thymidine phosphorylase
MNQPLGELVGNALEVVECLEVLKGRGPSDLVRLCEELSAHCLLLGDAAPALDEGRRLYREAIASGRALQKFRDIVRFQGGDVAVVDDYELLPRARHDAPITSPASGFILSMDTEKIGIAMSILGAGRETVDSTIDPAVGMRVHKKIGDHVDAGEPLATVYYNDESRYQEARRRLLESWSLSNEAPPRPDLIKNILC